MTIMMDIARQAAGLLTWQWVALILALSFRRTLLTVLDRIVRFRVGGKKGLEATLARLPQSAGSVIEPEPASKTHMRIDAELFVLRDKEENVRAKLGVTNTNATSFSLYDPNGKERLAIFVLPDGSSTVALYDELEARTMLLRAETAGVDGLVVLGPDRRNGGRLLVSSEGDPSIDITDQEGTRLFEAG
jgi:hypothetical protein